MFINRKLFVFVISFSMISCDEIVNQINDGSNSINGNNISAPPPPIPEYEITWKNGNTYTYNTKEDYQITDKNGNTTIVSLYRRNQPSLDEANCGVKTCTYCGKKVERTNITLTEFPEVGWVTGEQSLESIMGMFGLVLGSAFGDSHYDMDDKSNWKIRTEWRFECDYPGPEGFCSLKCQDDYKFR
jgi:hypothetical protein